LLNLSTVFPAPSANGNNSTWCDDRGTLLTLARFWFIWTVVFRSIAKGDDAETLLKRVNRWLLRASILELLVAVPSHIIVRHRDDCCAPAGTFWGIATGISLTLLCFGPGVFFLFMERFKRLHPKPPGAGLPPTGK